MTNKPSKHVNYLRFSNTKGQVIPMHHAFKTLHLGSVSRVSAFVLPVLFMSLIWLFLPLMLDIWARIFDFWMVRLYASHVGYSHQTMLGQELFIPYPILDAQFPSVDFVWGNLVICAIMFLLSFLLSPRLAPLTYFFRTTMLIQASASIDRLLSPDFFPYTLQLYLTDALQLCVYMLILMPLLLGFVYYIFDFGLVRKLVLTCMLLVFYAVAIPCQYMLHAMLIHEWSMLFLPIMYILFGVLIDVLTFVAIYSFGMSWRSRKTALQGRGL